MLRAYLFDLDGVLVHSYEAWFRLMNDTARAFGHPEIARERFHATFGQSTADDVRDFFPGCSLDEVERYFAERFRDHAAHMEIHPRGAAILARLRAGGKRVGICTNSPRPLALDILAAARLEPEVLVAGTDVPAPKPAPDMVLRALSLLETPAAEAILIGDSRFDREAARAAGVRFAGYGGISGDLTLRELDEVLGIAEAP